MLEQVLNKRDVSGHTPNTELAQGAVHPGNRGFRGWGPRGDFFQQAVVVPGDDRAGISGAAIEPDTHAGGPAIGRDAAIVGDKVVLWVFGRDAALQRVAVQLNIVLAGNTRGFDQRFALGD